MPSTVQLALDNFIAKFKQRHPSPPTLTYNSDWPSECYLEVVAEGTQVGWFPGLQQPASDMFQRLQTALDETIHPDIIAYYTRYWSDPLPATCAEGDLSLLLVWNPEDMERLRGNLIGHALSKRQQKRPLTFFIACTEPDSDHFISVDNFSGEVWLELPGKPPIKPLANNLAEFIDRLEPRTIDN